MSTANGTAGLARSPGGAERALGAVLVGGQGRRMGADKAILSWDGRPLALVVAMRIRSVVAEVAFVGGAGRGYERLGLPLIPDPPEIAGRGPMAGLVAALSAWSGPVVLVACDLPAIEPLHLQRLLAAACGSPATAPCMDGRLEPLCAVYRPAILGMARSSLAAGSGRMRDLFAHPGARRLAPAVLGPPGEVRRALRNINSPNELRTSSHPWQGGLDDAIRLAPPAPRSHPIPPTGT